MTYMDQSGPIRNLFGPIGSPLPLPGNIMTQNSTFLLCQNFTSSMLSGVIHKKNTFQNKIEI